MCMLMKRPKDLNMSETYVNDIRQIEIDVRYKGLRIIPSKSAAVEMMKHGFTIEDCKELLDTGYEPRKRAKDTIEKWLDKGRKTYNVVVVRSFNFMYDADVYLIKHIGRFTRKRIPRK